MTWFLRSIFVVFVLTAVGLLAGGIFLIVQRQTGTRATATVTECHLVSAGVHATDECTGTWVVGGSLLAGGHVVLGDIQGAERRDIGKTLNVTVRGDTAYTRGLGLPIGLTIGGLVGTVGLGLLTIKIWSPPARTSERTTANADMTASRST
jgi:hypothetical protein